MKHPARSKLDNVAFQKMRRIAPTRLASSRPGAHDDWSAGALPEEIALKLTNRCNLRCTHCYQWNAGGYHHALSRAEKNGDLDLAIVEKVLAATQSVKSNLFIWGGEPLAYRAWDQLIALLEQADRWISICTNGMLIEQRLESLLRISKRLEMFVALDGFELEHDTLRGKGTFHKTLQGIRALLNERTSARYNGELTVNCVIQDSMVGRLFEFVKFCQGQGIDAVYLSFPWFISKDTANLMDAYLREHLSWMTSALNGAKPSWHSYTFGLTLENSERLGTELSKIDAHNWEIKVRYNPALSSQELQLFLSGSHKPAQNKTRCLALKSRMDVYPNGDVVSCHLFPDFAVGNLANANVEEVWHGAPFDIMRKTVSECGLMPICAKCNLLYSRGI
jgi:radical SAM protein with 4Fe4S-binding SPASM domain